jgi:hypothetical protein
MEDEPKEARWPSRLTSNSIRQHVIGRTVGVTHYHQNTGPQLPVLLHAQPSGGETPAHVDAYTPCMPMGCYPRGCIVRLWSSRLGLAW